MLPKAAAKVPARVMFLYWGRRGAMVRFTIELARAAVAVPGLTPFVSVSRQNEAFDAFVEFGAAVFPVDTFDTNVGAVTRGWRLPGIRRRLARQIRQQRIDAVVNLMPHVWTPFVASAIRDAGAQYICVVHDADAHPGDRTAAAKPIFDRDLHHADLLITLSRVVTDRLIETGTVDRSKIVTLFLPEMTHGAVQPKHPRREGAPLRLLFLGRIMTYKGLPLLLDALDLVQARGVAVQLGVFGEGALGDSENRLRAMGAQIENRWLSDAEIEIALQSYDVVVASHIEASQSGVVATAHGHGLPVIVTPVGGLVEQVVDGVTGLVATAAEPRSLAAQITRLATNASLYDSMRASIAATRADRSMDRFVRACVAHAVRADAATISGDARTRLMDDRRGG
jgi:glycosyltransferase involved in cell wall biosynthesis